MADYFIYKKEVCIHDSIESYLREKKAIGGLSTSSIHNRNFELYRFSRFCKLHNMEFTHQIHKNILIAYLESLKVSKSTKVHILYVLTGFLGYLVENELIMENYASLIDKPRVYQPKTDYLTFSELERLYQSEARHTSRKTVDRNLLMFSLFTDTCLRVSEVIHLKFKDVRLESREVWVTRKRGKEDRIPIHEDIVEKFLSWYAVREEYKNSDLDWVFLSNRGTQLTPRQVHAIVSSALKRAGLIKRKQGPHLLRHSGASLKAQAGENLIMIQYLLGHENLNTTRRYLHFDWKELREMVERSPGPGKQVGTTGE